MDKKLYDKEYYIKNKERIKLRYENNKDKFKEYQKIYSSENKEKVKESNRIWYSKNKEKVKEKVREYQKKRKNNDPIFRLKSNIRTILSNVIKKKGFSKKSKIIDIIGCSFDDLIIHIESKFEPWMAWDNYGKYNGEFNYGWDIDHIVPIFMAKTEEDILKLNHYTNLQPLCSRINREIKRNTYNNP